MLLFNILIIRQINNKINYYFHLKILLKKDFESLSHAYWTIAYSASVNYNTVAITGIVFYFTLWLIDIITEYSSVKNRIITFLIY